VARELWVLVYSRGVKKKAGGRVFFLQVVLIEKHLQKEIDGADSKTLSENTFSLVGFLRKPPVEMVYFH